MRKRVWVAGVHEYGLFKVGHLNGPGAGWPPHLSAEVEARQQVLVVEGTHGVRYFRVLRELTEVSVCAPSGTRPW